VHACNVSVMTATEITIKGRTYTFTTEGAEEGSAIRTIGSLYNSRGQFAGLVTQLKSTGTLALIGGPKGVSVTDERKGLSVLANI